MTDPRSEDHLRDDEELVYDVDWEAEPEEAPLPPRARRRWITPVTGVFAAVLVAALGFIGGVEVQKGQDDGGTTAGATTLAASNGGSGGARGGLAGRGGPGGGAQSNATIGSVSNKHGSTLYVKDSDGNTVRVKTTSHSKINRTASTSAGAVHPGDTVIVQGSKSSDGTVTATQINATSSSASGGLGGLFGGGGGPGAGGGGQTQGDGQAAAPDGG